MPSSVIIHWPAKPSVLDPKRFAPTADAAVKVFAAAVVKLAQSRRGGDLISQRVRTQIGRADRPAEIMLLNELEKVEAATRTAYDACQREITALRAERDALQAKIDRARRDLS
jgi:ubiquinone biosynthesis protein UbiJ